MQSESLVKLFRTEPLLSARHYELVTKLSTFTERSIPEKFQVVEAKHVPESPSGAFLLEEEIENMQQFYNWVDQLQEQTGSKGDEKYALLNNRLHIYGEFCTDILSEINDSLDSLQNMEDQYNLVSKKTGELHHACEVLLQEQENLSNFAKKVEVKLSYFNEVDNITQLFSRPNLSVLDTKFLQALSRLDESITFISEHPSYLESRLYLMKFKQLQTRGLSMIKSYLVASLRNAGKQALNSSSGSAPNSPSSGSDDFETRAYLKFRLLSKNLRPLCHEIESRVQQKEYQSLLSDCHYCYFQQRYLLLHQQVEATISTIQKEANNDLSIILRSGCHYLVRVCQEEFDLYKLFFSSFSTAMRGLLETFGELLYTVVRPMFIRQHEIEPLCDAAHSLKTDIIISVQERGESVQTILLVIHRMLEDIQERLIYLSQMFIRDNIRTFSPSVSDLNYPQKLIAIREQNAHNEVRNIYASWYPTVEVTLKFLSRLYLSIDAKIFEGLAQETVSECCNSLLYAKRVITTNSGFLDGQLFLIKHLMILREQISPFDIEFCITEKRLDFSSMKESFSSLLSGSFSWKSNSFGSPKVVSYQVDSKKAMEKELLDSIEEFCRIATTTTLEPLTTLLITVNSYLRTKGESGAAALREERYATPDAIRAITDRFSQQIGPELKGVVEKINLYFDNPSNHREDLLGYLREFILRPFLQLLSILEAHYLPQDLQLINVDINTLNQSLL